MDFKLNEIDGFDEEEIDPFDQNSDNDITNEDEFDPLGVDDETDEEDSDAVAYEPDEPDESEDVYDEEEELDEESSPLVLEQQRIEIAPFNSQEENNFAYAEAVRAYYEEKNYEQAIEKFTEAIKNEKKQAKGKKSTANEIVAKSMYWQAEAYVKTQDIPKAIKTFESLVKTCQEHYLTISAQRRVEILKAKNS
ncbi:MAG: tetratricopeptide repeat protein [Candidatus Poribacteria bacterium]|nr:tetratricopeptide repeat protein [Candidatus Poribacteria bacterium]